MISVSIQQHDPSVRLSVVIVNYNGINTLPAMLKSIMAYPIELEEIIVVDDGSTDESVEWLHDNYPEVRVLPIGRNTGNVGYVRNQGLRAARGTHIFLADNDIMLLPGCLHELLRVIMSDPCIFCATPRLLYSDRPDIIYQDGNGIHFLALGIGNRRGTAVAQVGKLTPYPAYGGGIMMLDMAWAKHIGLFDEGYLHAWGDDGELHIRGALYGFKCLHVPTAVCAHPSKEHGTQRAFGQIYNRLRLLYTLYRIRTLILISPSLILFEMVLIAASIPGGFMSAYVRAVVATWRERRDILAMRSEIQRRRRVADSDVFWAGAFEVPSKSHPGRMVRVFVKGLQILFDANWRLVNWVDRQSQSSRSGKKSRSDQV
jgi:GT2 family glycosyltransferase